MTECTVPICCPFFLSNKSTLGFLFVCFFCGPAQRGGSCSCTAWPSRLEGSSSRLEPSEPYGASTSRLDAPRWLVITLDGWTFWST